MTESLLQTHAPKAWEDEALREYVCSLLEEPDFDEDTLESLLEPDEAAALLAALPRESTDGDDIKLRPAATMQPIKLGELLQEQATIDEEKETSSMEEEPVVQKPTKKQPKHSRKKKTEQRPEDDASAWTECEAQGKKWGGRGRGGRGAYAGATNSIHSNIHLSPVTISNSSSDLLRDATMDIVKGHRYGLVGRNGVGKSTLLHRLAERSIPGMPRDMRILLVQQHVEGTDQSALETLMEADLDRLELLEEQEEVERIIESDDIGEHERAEAAERLGEIYGELDAIRADEAEQRAKDILSGLQFTSAMMEGPTKNLSGGWRMRLSLAQALFVTSDLILFDECTNHLDLHGLDWLIGYLQKNTDRTLIVVSHDRSFLDAICTDIVVMHHQRLDYHVGSYSDYEHQVEEKAARDAQKLDAAERQRAKAQAFIQKQQTKSADPKKQKQAKMMKEKKLDRIGNFRDDGKKYKQFSMQKMSSDYVRLAQKVHVEADEAVVAIRIPEPAWPSGLAPGDPIVTLEDVDFGYTSEKKLLDSMTLSLCRGSKVAMVGRNGAGKTTLMKLIGGEVEPNRGRLWRHPNLRVGYVTQYAVEELDDSRTVLEYAEGFKSSSAAADVIAKASGNVRQYLGSFGLGGKHALQPISELSGGERMRLCLAEVLAAQPHLLLLDESTNHVDLETLDCFSRALQAYQGSVLMVSHNQSFLSGFCTELWSLAHGKMDVLHSDTASFDELFSEYRSGVLQQSSVSTKRAAKANLAKRAAQNKPRVTTTSLL